jgi:hypothetical protein
VEKLAVAIGLDSASIDVSPRDASDFVAHHLQHDIHQAILEPFGLRVSPQPGPAALCDELRLTTFAHSFRMAQSFGMVQSTGKSCRHAL